MSVVVVTGGRNYSNKVAVAAALSAIGEIELLIHGGANGADLLCAQWAKRNGISVRIFAADWNTYGRSAGPRRNKEMMAYACQFKENALCVVFPGGAGTANAKRCAISAGIPVREQEV